jgi:hypothetical protein
MQSVFDLVLYEHEMTKVLQRAAERLRAERPRLVIYSLSIWTDAPAKTSALSIDTKDNSEAKCARLRAFAAEQRAAAEATGETEMARLWARPISRNINPAEFALRDFAVVEHRSFDADWTAEDYWQELAPALARVRVSAREIFRSFPLHPEAQVAVNSPREWYDEPVALRSAAI